MEYFLEITLRSDTCFSGGIGCAGDVDIDIEQEEATGLPLVRGRTLKGLLVEECAFLLKTMGDRRWREAAECLFGNPGGQAGAYVGFGDGLLPDAFRSVVEEATKRPQNALNPRQVLQSLTDVRFQTKINRETHTPEEHSLRSARLALKGLVFHSRLIGADRLSVDARAMLAACALATRRAGLNRNRGWGRLRVRIVDACGNDVTQSWIAPLKSEWEVRP